MKRRRGYFLLSSLVEGYLGSFPTHADSMLQTLGRFLRQVAVALSRDRDDRLVRAELELPAEVYSKEAQKDQQNVLTNKPTRRRVVTQGGATNEKNSVTGKGGDIQLRVFSRLREFRGICLGEISLVLMTIPPNILPCSGLYLRSTRAPLICAIPPAEKSPPSN